MGCSLAARSPLAPRSCTARTPLERRSGAAVYICWSKPNGNANEQVRIASFQRAALAQMPGATPTRDTTSRWEPPIRDLLVKGLASPQSD